MAAVYYKQMVSHGKNHKQALGAVMGHPGARVLKVLPEDRPYELRDIDGKRQPKLLNLYNSTVSQDKSNEGKSEGQKALDNY